MGRPDWRAWALWVAWIGGSVTVLALKLPEWVQFALISAALLVWWVVTAKFLTARGKDGKRPWTFTFGADTDGKGEE